MKASPLRYEDLASLAGVSGQGWEFYGVPVALKAAQKVHCLLESERNSTDWGRPRNVRRNRNSVVSSFGLISIPVGLPSSTGSPPFSPTQKAPRPIAVVPLVSSPIRETLASYALYGKRRTFAIVDAKGDAVIISKIVFGQIPMQMLLFTVLIDAAHTALEH